MPRQRLPRHVGFIPDGNRRWALAHGLARQEGYSAGIAPGLALYDQCAQLGVDEVSIYGFTVDNTRRPAVQQDAFTSACVEFATAVAARGAALLVLGDESGRRFPEPLRQYRRRRGNGLKVNLLCNYGWDWDLEGMRSGKLRSAEVPRLDLIVRWGGGRRLSGFLPAQSVYADFHIVDELWPDYQPRHFTDALSWFAQQDRTLGG